MLRKIKSYIKSKGLFFLLKKIFFYPSQKIKYSIHLIKIKNLKNNKEKFDYIYENKIWSSGETLSGIGSSLEYTKNLRKNLPLLFEKYEIKSFLDVPCGDFNWMSEVLKKYNINYIGCDIVESLIEDLKKKYSSEFIQFKRLDMCQDELPKVDLIFVRDCLFHLSFQDIQCFINNFKKSNIKYILTSSHKNIDDFENIDIDTGSFRKIDLFKHPFNFSKDFKEEIIDFIEPYPERSMFLWSRDNF